MRMADVKNVSEQADALAVFMQEVLDRVCEAYRYYGMPVPDRHYWTLATPAVDCEQLVVSMIQMYIGTPGDEANEPRRCNDPRSATLNISVSRAVPVVGDSGNAPRGEDIQAASVVGAYDAWILMESVREFDVWGDPGSLGLGVIATVDAGPPEGGFQTVTMTLTLAVP
jgi:hypothetical protein